MNDIQSFFQQSNIGQDMYTPPQHHVQFVQPPVQVQQAQYPPQVKVQKPEFTKAQLEEIAKIPEEKLNKIVGAKSKSSKKGGKVKSIDASVPDGMIKLFGQNIKKTYVYIGGAVLFLLLLVLVFAVYKKYIKKKSAKETEDDDKGERMDPEHQKFLQMQHMQRMRQHEAQMAQNQYAMQQQGSHQAPQQMPPPQMSQQIPQQMPQQHMSQQDAGESSIPIYKAEQ